jgi:7-cyano-7-deazaguanine synthase
MKKIVIGLSGGMDSATLLGSLLEQRYEVHCCTFYYGSKHGKWESKASEDLIDFYKLDKKKPVFKHSIDLSVAFKEFNSALLLTGEEIPEGHYNDETMKKTVVPGRNLIFSSIMAGLAESIDADEIGLGVHAGDHAIYPDCRPDFISSLWTTILRSTENKIRTNVPFLNKTKADILKIGCSLIIPVPYQLTRTCYRDQELACGRCGACDERLSSFKELNLIDPIEYEK